MALNSLPATAGGFRLAPVEPRHAPLFCFALLTVSCALASFALACATPFAAFTVVAAAMLPLRPGLFVVMGTWLVNQMIGFGAHHYPIVLALTLVCAYGAYEVALFAVTPFLGGAGAFTAAIIARLGFLNAMWLIGLVAVCESIRLVNPFRRGRAVST
jgi:hypothetical protein